MPRFTGGAVGALAYDAVSAFEPTVPLPGARPGRRPDGGLHRDRPRPRLRPPDPHAVGDRLAPHRGARPRGPLPDRRGGDLRGARADVAAERRRDGRRVARRGAAGPRRRRRAAVAGRAGRDEPRPRRVHPRRRGRQGRDRGRRGDPGRARPAPVVRPAGRPGDGRAARRHRAVPGPPPGQPEPVPVLRPDADLRGRRRLARSCSSRSRATGSRPTRSPAPGRAAPTPARTRSSPRSSSATRRSAPST